MKRSVLIVDDHAGFRGQARALLAAAGYEVVGETGEGASGIRATRDLRPDLVLLDVQLPDMSGFEVARRIREQSDRPVVVLISSREASDYGAGVERSGALGFISKADLSAGALRSILQRSEP